MTNIQSHFSRLSRLLTLERDYDRQSFETAVRSALHNNYNNTNCWYPVTVGNAYYNAVNQYVVEVEYTGKYAVSQDCEFEPGKTVRFFYREDEREERVTVLPDSCFIVRYEGRKLLVAANSTDFPILLHRLAENHTLGVQLGIDETTYQVMNDALQRAQSLDSEKWVHLRDTLIGSLKPENRNLPPMRFENLNDSQNLAVNRILNAREVAVVHGPPGTGKTTTLVEAIMETTRREPQVLVCAPSNAAIDWISTRLIARGVSLLRVGNPLRINKPLLESTYENRYAAHPDYPELWSVRKLLRELHAAPVHGRTRHSQLQRLHRRAEELELKIHEEIMQQAEVVACTLIGSANRVLEHRHFGTLFIDEATQALEAACWAAILKADRVVFAGDHQQLPPTIKCVEAARGGLDRTLMQRIVETKPETVTMLDTQYRMNEAIMNFSSRWFYDGRLKAAPEVAHRTLAPWDAPLVWVDTSGQQFTERVNASQSRLNRAEAMLLTNILKEYVRQLFIDSSLFEKTTIGIISPYKAQISILRHLVNKSHTLAPIRHNISVNTVDGFQGQERDIILISMVRDNEQGSIGFLKDLRRMNVAITRAKRKLIVVGNCETLAHTHFYHELIDYFQENGIVKR
ncbi:MAG: AAA family ATPase [Bacteroidales bacterium]|nr:AAA family ATPase [Bacteroidales bacterium]